jgi:hypothetical protein
MAYAPDAAPPADRANIVPVSASTPRSARPASANRNVMAANDLTTVTAKSQGVVVATATQITASRISDTAMRVMMLAPSASTSMSVTVLGDAIMTLLSKLFVKPPASVVMGFSDDPQAGLTTDRFSGSVATPLTVQSFALRTASLR